MVLKIRGGEEGCVAMGSLCRVDFVSGQYPGGGGGFWYPVAEIPKLSRALTLQPTYAAGNSLL